MDAIEFETDVQNGIVKIPNQYNELNSKHVRVIALLDDLEMLGQPKKTQTKETRLFSDEYINAHWRELIMTTSTNPQQDDDKILQDEYGEYLSAKHSS
ncbi:MAG: hypothetical protein HOP34_09315 [Methylococcaceae bacterium]|nr:hypothetical protein [Methylococcaceae bacterium]